MTKALRVGPESAEVVPSLVYYGKGGERAIVIDANTPLSYLPNSLLGRSFNLDLNTTKKVV